MQRDDEEQEDRMPQAPPIIVRVGSVEMDIPRSLGYFGGIAAAVSVGLLEPPLAVAIAAIPFVKMLDRPGVPQPGRFVAEILDGAMQPVGSTGEGTVRIYDETSDD
jgi:hypothetical protein